MNHVYRLIWNRAYGMFVPAAELTRANGKCASRKTTGHRKGHAACSMSLGALVFLLSSQGSHATTFLDLTGGIAGWTTSGTVSVLNSTDSITFQDNTDFSLTPATGESMVKISAQGAAEGSVNSVLGLSANTIEGFLNNANGHITNYGLMTNTLSFGIGTYTFSWAYAAEDYQPYNDGALFSLVGAGTQSIVSLARNGSSPSDTSGPSPNTMILGSYGSTAWETTSFTISTAGSYQIGFASYNWDDTSLEPNLYVGRIEGTFTGTPVTVAGGPVVMDVTNGNVSPSVYDTSSDAYAEPSLTFDGGTLQYSANTTTNKDTTLDSGGGTIDTNGNAVLYTGLVSGAGAFTKAGNGALTLTNSNSYTGLTTITNGTLALQGSGSIAASSGVNNNSSLDISGTTAGASITTMSGNGTVALGSKTLTLTDASDTFSGVIGGTGGLTVTDGTETLSGINTYSGATSIAGGATINLSGVGSIANSSVVNNNGTLNIAATSSGASIVSLSGNSAGTVVLGSKTLTLTDANDNFAGVISGTGGVSVTDGTETLSGINTYSGATSIANGSTIALSGAGSIAASSGVADNGTLDISGTTTGASIKTLSGNGTVGLGSKVLTLTNATDTFDGVIGGTGGVTVSGGTETLTGVNSYTGTTSIGASGAINLSGVGSIAASSGVTNNGVLNISATNSGAALTTLAGSGSVGLGSKTLTLTNASNTFTGVIGGSGNVTIAGGTETLSGVNTYTGATNLASGTILNLNGAGSIATSSGIANNGLLDISGTTAGASVKTLSGNGAIGLGSKFLTLTNANDTFAGVIGGTGGVNLSNGTQTLTGVNTYAGATTVATGATLSLSGAGSIANSSAVNNSGTLDISATNSGAAMTGLSGASTGSVVLGGKALTLTNANDIYAGVITGTGPVSVAGGTQTLSGINTYSGATSIANGAIINLIGSGSIANSSGIANNGTLNISSTTSGAVIKTLSGNGAVGLGSKTLTLTNANDIFAGNIAGTGSIIVSGGTQAFNNINSYTGATSINTGATINLSGAGNIATSSGVTNNGLFDISGVTTGASIKTLSGGGTVALGSKALTLTNANDIFAGTINGNGSLAISTGTTTLTGVNTYSGATSIGSGSTIAIANAGSIANSNSVLNNGTLDISSATTGASLKSLSGSGTVTLGNKALTLTNSSDTFAGVVGGVGDLSITGGMQTLSAVNTYSGATTIANGAVISLSGSGSIAASSGINNDGALDISSVTTGASIKTLAGTGTVSLGTKKLTLNNASGTFAGSIGGAGEVELTNGSEALTDTNTYTGATTIGNGATITLSGAGSIATSSGVANNGALDISGTTSGAAIKTLSGSGTVGLGGKSLTLTNANDTFGGVINGTGSLVIASGTTTLTGNSTYSGNTSIGSGSTIAIANAGSIANSHSVLNDGMLDISSAITGASLKSLSGSGTVALGAKALTLTNADDSFTGVIGGTGDVTIINGNQTLVGINTYLGTTSIDIGATINLSGVGSIAASNSITNNGWLDISGSTTGVSLKTLAGNGVVSLGTKSLTLINANDSFTGVIDGTGSFILSSGTETLMGINTYSGNTSIGSGSTIAISHAGSIANSNSVISNGRLDISGATTGVTIKTLSGTGSVGLGGKLLALSDASDTFAGVIDGTGSVTIDAGTETLSGDNTYTGTTSIGDEATLKLKDAGGVAQSFGIDNDGRLDISEVTSSAAIKTLAGSGHITLGDKTLVLTNAGHNFTGVIDGIGNLNIAGGIEALSGVNTYSGVTSIASGANLMLANAGSVTTSRSINNNGIFDISTTNSGAIINTLTGAGLVNLGDKVLTLSNASDDFAGVIAGTGSVDLVAGDEQLSGVNQYSGATSIANDATLHLAGAGSIATSSRLSNRGVFDISATDSGAAIKTLSGDGTINLGNKTLVLTQANDNFAGVIAGNSGVSVIGGTETLSGLNTYKGGTHIANDGKVVIASDASLGDAAGGLSFDDGTLQTTASLTSARNISLVGDAAFTQDAGTVLTATGQISGDGHLYKEGDGTLILSGDNRYWGTQGSNSLGGLTIDSGLVEVTNSYGLGYGLVTVNSGMITTTVDIVTGQTVAVTGDLELHTDADTTTNLTGTVVSTDTSSCFNKTGEGTLVMSGNALLTNGTCVLEGNLYANGMLESNVSVDAGAMLRGTGVIVGPVNVQGTLAPGNSPGTLVVNGTVTMTAGSTYQEDINGTGIVAGPGNYSHLLITGAGNQFIAAGSTLAPNLVNVTGSVTYTPYVPALGDSFRIVTAAGGIVGRFSLAQPAGLATGTRLAAFYDVFDSNSIDLRVIPTSYASYLHSAGGNKNAQSMGNTLDQLLTIDQNATATTKQDELAYEVAGLSASSLSNTATALAGEVHGALAAIAPQADQWLQGSITRQLAAVGMANDIVPHRAVWIDSTTNHSKWSADTSASSFTANRAQLAIGFDLLGSDSGIFGIGLSTASVDTDAAGGKGSVNANVGFVYGRYQAAGTVFDGIASYGTNTWKTQRDEPLAQTAALTTSSRGHTSLLSVSARWPLQAGAISLAPYGRVTWQQSARAAFDESPSTPSALTALAAPKYSETGTRFTAGFAGGSAQQRPLSETFTYQFNVGLSHDSGDLVHPTVRASLMDIDTRIVSPQVSRFSVQANLTGTARVNEQAYVYLGLTGEARNGKSDDLGVNAGVRASF